MEKAFAHFNRLLLTFLGVLFVLSLSGFAYANWRVDPQFQLWNLIVSSLILALPLLLFYGAIYVLVRAWRERRTTGQVDPSLAKIIRRSARGSAIGIIFFVSLFSLDVFAMEGTTLEKLGGFIIHSLPSIGMILVLVIAWRRPQVGFFAFLLAGLFFLRFVLFGFNLPHFLLFSGPLLLISALFYMDWRWLKPQPPASPEPVV